MRTLLTLFFFVFIASTSCNNFKNKDEEAANESQTLVSVEDFYANPDNYIGKVITVKGLVTHVCKHGGQKLFITGTGDTDALRIDVGKDIPEFDISMEGNKAEFTGLLELMNEEAVACAEDEHKEHHPEGEGSDEGYHVIKDKNYHLIASSFKSL